MKVVLQDFANAVRSGTWPRSNLSSFSNSLPYTTTVPGQATVEAGWTTRALSSAVAVTILNVDPAGNLPPSPSSNPTLSLSATARTAPVDGRIATSAVACGTVATAASAAVCTDRSSVVRTGVPAVPGSVASAFVPALTVAPGLPARVPFRARCSPDTPTWAVAS